jgi:hypothetical protein
LLKGLSSFRNSGGDFVEFDLSQIRLWRCRLPVHPRFHRLQLRSSNHIGSDPKSAGATGDWTSADGKEKLKLRSLDDSIYIVYYDGDLFRAYHSDVAETPFATVQDLNSSDRKYAFIIWKLSDDGKNRRLRSVNDKVVPKETKDPATVVALLTKNARNPELFGEEIEFKKEK